MSSKYYWGVKDLFRVSISFKIYRSADSVTTKPSVKKRKLKIPSSRTNTWKRLVVASVSCNYPEVAFNSKNKSRVLLNN